MVDVMKPQNALGELVTQVCEANGWSRNEVAKRAQDRGHSISSKWISLYCGQIPLKGIQGDMIHALAAGLGVSAARVALAAVEAMGVSVTDNVVSPAEAIARDPQLSEDTRSALLAILRTTERRRGA